MLIIVLEYPGNTPDSLGYWCFTNLPSTPYDLLRGDSENPRGTSVLRVVGWYDIIQPWSDFGQQRISNFVNEVKGKILKDI